MAGVLGKNSERFLEAAGKQGANSTGPAGKVGNQYMNAGLSSPQSPDIASMLGGTPLGQQQKKKLGDEASILDLLMGGRK